jgi:hypothetical protein
MSIRQGLAGDAGSCCRASTLQERPELAWLGSAAELHEAVDVAISGWPTPPGGCDASPAGTGLRAQMAT